MDLVTETSIYREKESNQILLLSQWFYNQKMVLKQNNCQNYPVNQCQYCIICLKPSGLATLSAVSRKHLLWSEQQGTNMSKAILGDSLSKIA